MNWLAPNECSLLQPGNGGDTAGWRPIQRFLELTLAGDTMDSLAATLLEEIGTTLQADHALILDSPPHWRRHWSYIRRGLKVNEMSWPRNLLHEVLDRRSAVLQPAESSSPGFLATPLGGQPKGDALLYVAKSRGGFTLEEFHYAVAAGHYVGVALDRAGAFGDLKAQLERHQALADIAGQLLEQRDVKILLREIAEQAARLLQCERASLFLWDKARQELVGRPALGMPHEELRLPDSVGIVGKVIATGEICQVDQVSDEPAWSSESDKSSGFRTRNLLCVPMVDPDGECLGALEVLNRREGRFGPADVETLQTLARLSAVALENVRERESLLRSNAELENQARKGSLIVGQSTVIEALRSTVDRVARTELPVLVLGESGTGKEVVARSIHYSSPRHRQPFIPVNCAAIAESLLESELFGHEKGAFTDAHVQRQGKFELASGGTLFLDEIGDLSPGGQAKLLRVLEEKIVYRVGGSQAIPVDTRIIAATNRNLGESVRTNRFREDLFYRLTVVTIDLPPLRDRQEDVLVLAEHFLEQFSRDAGRKPLRLSAESKKRLGHHNWPGNVRELRNLMERVAFLCPKDKVDPEDLAFILRPAESHRKDLSTLPLAEATDDFQCEHIRKAIERMRGNMSEAARLLGMHRSNLYRKMKQLGMEIPE